VCICVSVTWVRSKINQLFDTKSKIGPRDKRRRILVFRRVNLDILAPFSNECSKKSEESKASYNTELREKSLWLIGPKAIRIINTSDTLDYLQSTSVFTHVIIWPTGVTYGQPIANYADVNWVDVAQDRF
jgi:hypothetical protein